MTIKKRGSLCFKKKKKRGDIYKYSEGVRALWGE